MTGKLPHKEAETIRRRWQPAALDALRALMLEGKTNDELAAQLDRTKAAVQLAAAVIGYELWPDKAPMQIVAERKRLRLARTDRPAPSPDKVKLGKRYEARTPHARKEPRKCLGGCGGTFMSTHKFNRVCDNCSPRISGAVA